MSRCALHGVQRGRVARCTGPQIPQKEYSKAIKELSSVIQHHSEKYGCYDEDFASLLANLSAAYERRSTSNETYSKYCDIADSVRYYLAAAIIRRRLFSGSDEYVQTITQLSSFIHSQISGSNIDTLTNKFTKLFESISTGEFLLDISLRYSFLCIIYPVNIQQIALKEKVSLAN